MNVKNILLWVWILLLLIIYIVRFSAKVYNLEGFTPKINSLYRPHLRRGRLYIESFMNKYSPEYFIKLLKKPIFINCYFFILFKYSK